MEFKQYRKTGVAVMRPYVAEEDLTGISVSSGDVPKSGGMVARNPHNHEDQWYVSAEFFEENYEPVVSLDGACQTKKGIKTLNNSDINGARKQVADLKVVGNGDMFQLLCKASSKAEDWMKSTKAVEIPGVGCVMQVTTQQGGQVAEAATFVPGVVIVPDEDGGRKLVSKLEAKCKELAKEK